MASTSRILSLLLIFGPLAAMFSEPFYAAVYDLLGWDTEDLAGPFLLFLQRMTGSAIFLPSALGFMGVGLGVWLHYLAIRFDKRRPSTSDSFVDLHDEIGSLRNELWQSLRGDDGIINFESPIYEVKLKLRSLDTRLKKIGLGLNLLEDWSLTDQRLMMTIWLQILQVYSKDGMIALAREEIDVAIKHLVEVHQRP